MLYGRARGLETPGTAPAPGSEHPRSRSWSAEPILEGSPCPRGSEVPQTPSALPEGYVSLCCTSFCWQTGSTLTGREVKPSLNVGTPERVTLAWPDMQEILGFNGPVSSRNEPTHLQKRIEMMMLCSTPARSVYPLPAACPPWAAEQDTGPCPVSPLPRKQGTATRVKVPPRADRRLGHVALFFSLSLSL